MHFDTLLHSICRNCRWCERVEFRYHGGPTATSYQCQIPINRHKFGRVTRTEDCRGFFLRVQSTETDRWHVCTSTSA